MKIQALIAILIGLSLPSLGQAPDQKKDSLRVDPARDLYDLATLLTITMPKRVKMPKQLNGTIGSQLRSSINS